MRTISTAKAIAALIVCGAMATAAAQKPFADVGKQEPMTILIPSTPWLPAFTKIVELYEQQTGNKIKLDVNPFGGVLDKARNDVRSSSGTYDVVMLDTQWTIEFYEGGFLTPLTDIEAGFDTPKEVLRYGDSGYWNEKKRWRTANGGKLMAFTPLGNIPVWYYRADALKDAGVTPPKTVSDIVSSCAKLSKPPNAYGAAIRAERGNPVRYEWFQWMVSGGGTVAKDPENGDYTVVFNSPQNKATLDAFIDVLKKCGTPNPGAMSQGEVIQLLATGKALQAQLVVAAWGNLQDPSQVGGCRQARCRADSAHGQRQVRRRSSATGTTRCRRPPTRRARSRDRVRQVVQHRTTRSTRTPRPAASRTAATCSPPTSRRTRRCAGCLPIWKR
jgi:multiple sugar transport system substrate-binding protein